MRLLGRGVLAPLRIFVRSGNLNAASVGLHMHPFPHCAAPPRRPLQTQQTAVRILLVLVAFASGASDAGLRAQPVRPARGFDVVHYTARVEPDLTSKSVRGRVVLSLVVKADGLRALELNSGDLIVDTVHDGARAEQFEQHDRRLIVRLARPGRLNEKRELAVEYHGVPRFGLQFFPDRPQAYTIFSTSQWLVCDDAPDDRATLDLTVVLPAALIAVASGRAMSQRREAPDTMAFQWRQDRPVPTYTFGFAAGRFIEAIEPGGRPRFRYLGDGFSDAELRRIFRSSKDMMAFFEDRAGVPYADDVYTQVLVASTAGQEMSGFAVMSDAYGRAVLEDPGAASLAAHELAHQWWGNRITCRDWTHFWLNEGFATFMAAAYDERRFGRERYLGEIAAIRARYERVRDAGRDRSLVFPDWDRPTPDDRTLVYQKGAYVLHQLRETLGNLPFWDGVRRYTRANIGKSVITVDFQKAMEASSRRDLSEFFDTWVYLTRTDRVR